MKISLTCKLDSAGAYGFIKPISDISRVSSIHVFRDDKALECNKVTYYPTGFIFRGVGRQISKFLNMIRIVNNEYTLSVGIYEIPHGLLAFLIGKIYKIPIAVSIISNPGYKEIRKGVRKKLTNYMLNRSEFITVTGNRSKQILINDGINNQKINILPNSIDTKKFKPISNNKDFDIISLGRLTPEKKIDNLVRLVKTLTREKPEIKVGIAGKGPEKENLQKMVHDMRLQNNISFLGYVDDIVGYYNKGKVFVLTSETEGLPRTVIEAMACGVPCVASNVGDLEDLIDDGITGYLVDDINDFSHFLKKINLLLNQENIYQEISENSRKKIQNKYSFQAATKVWEEIISKLKA